MANITRFDPLGEVVSLRSAMDRLFEDSFVGPVSTGNADIASDEGTEAS